MNHPTVEKRKFTEIDISKIAKTVDVKKLEKMDVTMENGMLPVLGTFGASLVLLVAIINATISMTESMAMYAKSLASVTMILSFILLARIKQLAAMSIFIRYFLFLWSFVGGCILTFGYGPFTSTGNGYFTVWAMTIFSFLSLGINYDSVKSKVAEHASPLASLGFCSFIVFLAVLPFFGSTYYWETIFTMAVSVVSFFLVGHLVFKVQSESKLPDSAFYTLLFLSIMWIFTAGIATFRGPFLVTGNGYFACWGAAIVGIIATKDAYVQINSDGIEELGYDEEQQQEQQQQFSNNSNSPHASPRASNNNRAQRPDDGTASRTAMMTTV